MNVTTRTYYMPRNRISTHIINYMVSKVGCSIGDIKVNKVADTIRVPITCNDIDVPKVERILSTYGFMEERND